MVPFDFVDVYQETDGLWPCPCCPATTFTPEELYEHVDVAQHPTGPYYLLRGIDGIVEIQDISQALVLHEEWGMGEGEVYWLVDDHCSVCTQEAGSIAVQCCCCSKVYCIDHFPKGCKLTRLRTDPGADPVDFMMVCSQCAAEDKKLYNQAYQLKALRHFHRFELVPVSVGTGRDKKTAYTINITGSKKVAVSKKYGRKAYETMQRGKVAPCFDTQPVTHRSLSHRHRQEEDFDVTECHVCGTDIVSRKEGGFCQMCSAPCHKTCMGGAFQTLLGSTNTIYPAPVCNACADTEVAAPEAEAEQKAEAEQVNRLQIKECLVCGLPAVKKGYCRSCWPEAKAKNQKVWASIQAVMAEGSELADTVAENQKTWTSIQADIAKGSEVAAITAIRAAAQAKQQAAADAHAQQQADAQAKQQADAQAKQQAPVDAHAKQQADARAKQQAAVDAHAKQQADARVKQKADAHAHAQQQADAQAKQQADAQAKQQEALKKQEAAKRQEEENPQAGCFREMGLDKARLLKTRLREAIVSRLVTGIMESVIPEAEKQQAEQEQQETSVAPRMRTEEDQNETDSATSRQTAKRECIEVPEDLPVAKRTRLRRLS